MRTAHRRLALVGVLEAAAVGTVITLRTMPELRIEWTDPTGWVEATQPVDAIAALAFHVLAVVTLWLTLTTGAYAAARVARRPALAAAVGAVTLPRIRVTIDRSIAMLATATALSLSLGAPAMAQEPSGIAPPGSDSLSYVPVPAGFPAEPSRTASPDAPIDGTYVVVRGDSFWRIAARHAGPEDVASYWRRLVAANAATIRSGNPDLIYPGEVIELPPTEGP